MLRNRTLIPPLSIHTLDGRVVRAWVFKQKKNLVVAFLDASCGSCEGFLQQLAAQSSALRAREAVVLVALLEAPSARLAESLPPEILVGCEMSGRAARAFLGDDALSLARHAASSRGLERHGIFVTDRYGELFAQWVSRGHEFPAVGEILASIDYAEMACDQCGAPAWPADA